MSTKCPPPHLRGAAEKQLAESSPSEVSARSDKELLHELQVHQIELEMQSEALIEAHLALKESRARFVDLYDFAPVGYLTITDKGFIAEINLAGAALLGAERCNLLQHRFSPFVVLDDGDRWRSHFLGVLKTGEKRTCELALKRVDGSHVHVRLDSVRLIKVAQTPALRVVLTDITERKQREIALCDERERIATILDTVGDPIFVKDNDHRIVLANHAFYDIFGLDKDNVIGKTLAEEVPDDEKQHFLGVDRRVLDTGEPDQREETLTSNGLSRTIITRKSRFVEGSGEKFLVGSIHDITEHKQAEEEQASLSQRLLLATSSAALGVWDWNVRDNPCSTTPPTLSSSPKQAL